MEVHVRIVEAKDIAKMDTVGATDAFCLISINKVKEQQTKIVSSMTPKWEQDFTFPVTNPVADYIHIVMKDQDTVSDDVMSKLDINVSALPVGVVVDHWYPMQPSEKVNKGGLIHLILHAAPVGAPPFQQRPQCPIPKGPLKLHIRLIEGKEIAQTDSVGSSDPYCVLSINTTQAQKSKVASNQMLPKWEEEFHFDITNPDTEDLIIKMMDKDVAADDDMGLFRIPVKYLPFQVLSDQWVTLQASKRVKKGGLIHILCHFTFPGAAPFIPAPFR